jgi:hypothetical protein
VLLEALSFKKYSKSIIPILSIFVSINLCFSYWQGLPVFAIGVGHSTYDKASVIAICLLFIDLARTKTMELVALTFCGSIYIFRG